MIPGKLMLYEWFYMIIIMSCIYKIQNNAVQFTEFHIQEAVGTLICVFIYTWYYQFHIQEAVGTLKYIISYALIFVPSNWQNVFDSFHWLQVNKVKFSCTAFGDFLYFKPI